MGQIHGRYEGVCCLAQHGCPTCYRGFLNSKARTGVLAARFGIDCSQKTNPENLVYGAANDLRDCNWEDRERQDSL